MARAPISVRLSAKERTALRALLKSGIQQVRVVLRALTLLQLDQGVRAPQVARSIPLTPQVIRRIGHRYRDGGLERALYEKPRPGAAPLLEKSEKQRIIAMVCVAIRPKAGHAGRSG